VVLKTIVARVLKLSWTRIAFYLTQIAIAVGLCWILFSTVDIQQLVVTLSRAHFGYLVAAVATMFVERIVRTYRLARLLGGQVALTQIIAVQSVSQLVNLILPMRSGEMLLVIMLRTMGQISGSFALSVVVVDRLMDMVCVLMVFALAILAMPGLPAYVDQAAVFLATLCALVVAVILILVLARSKAVLIADNLLARVMKPARATRWRQRFEQIIEGFAVLLDISRLVLAILTTLATWSCATLAIWLVLAAIWPGAPYAAAALALCLSVIGVTLVSVPAGIGVTHAAFTLAAVAFGASQEVGLAFAIIGHFLATTVTIIFGLLGLPVVRRAGMTILGPSIGVRR
jgi:uncharacterized protein (TIRG00374 family)